METRNLGTLRAAILAYEEVAEETDVMWHARMLCDKLVEERKEAKKNRLKSGVPQEGVELEDGSGNFSSRASVAGGKDVDGGASVDDKAPAVIALGLAPAEFAAVSHALPSFSSAASCTAGALAPTHSFSLPQNQLSARSLTPKFGAIEPTAKRIPAPAAAAPPAAPVALPPGLSVAPALDRVLGRPPALPSATTKPSQDARVERWMGRMDLSACASACCGSDGSARSNGCVGNGSGREGGDRTRHGMHPRATWTNHDPHRGKGGFGNRTSQESACESVPNSKPSATARRREEPGYQPPITSSLQRQRPAAKEMSRDWASVRAGQVAKI